nr:hypothetical protein GCM10020093_004930 [Planobispora longispora]
MREGFRKLGITPEEVGVRLLKIGMLWPLEPEIVRAFARGLEEILVVEEKAPLLETLVKDVLYGTAGAPRVLGKLDENGAPLIPQAGAVDADLAAKAVAFRLRRKGIATDQTPSGLGDRVSRNLAVISRPEPLKLLTAQRTPFFCSGCPHNRSTAVPDGAPVGAASAATPWWSSTPRARARSPA